MKLIQKGVALPRDQYYELHLTIINCLLPVKMTGMEIKTVAAFMGLEGPLADYRFGPSAKKIVMRQLKISPAGMSNYIGSLLEKGLLLRSVEGLITIWPLLVPEPEVQEYRFKLINLGNDQDITGGNNQGVLGGSEAQVSTA